MASCPFEAMPQEYPSELTTFERTSRIIGSSSTIKTFSTFDLTPLVDISGTKVSGLECISWVSVIRLDPPFHRSRLALEFCVVRQTSWTFRHKNYGALIFCFIHYKAILGLLLD